MDGVTALYHKNLFDIGDTARSGQLVVIKRVCVRELVGELQFVRKLRSPSSPHLTTLVLDPTNLPSTPFQLAVISPDLS